MHGLVLQYHFEDASNFSEEIKGGREYPGHHETKNSVYHTEQMSSTKNNSTWCEKEMIQICWKKTA